MFVYTAKVKMHHMDVAGSMFFANYFQVAHDAYESFLEYLTFDPSYIFAEGYMVPIVHAEADYQKAVRLSDKLTVEISVEKIGKSSFTLAYQILNQQCEPVAKLKTVHAFTSQETQKPVPIPEAFRVSLQNLSHPERSGQVF